MRTLTRKITESIYEPLNAELYLQPASVMDYEDEFFKISPNGDLAVVGYLVDDGDCASPLDGDGMGEIVTARRHAPRGEHAKMQKALGLDSDWQPDYALLDDDVVKAHFLAMINENKTVIADHEANGHGESLTEFASRLFDEKHPDSAYYQAWLAARRDGTIGNPFAVSLDVYEHSGVKYSVSTGSRTNDFDTASGGALWIPDSEATENIRYRAVQSLLPAGTKVEYRSRPEVLNEIVYELPDGTVAGGFPNFNAAINAAAQVQGVALDPQVVATAMRSIAEADAAQIAEVYTEWCNGNNYGFVIEQFELDENGKWEHTEEDSSYGFVGSDDGLLQMRAEAQAVADQQKEENEATFVACSEASLGVLENARYSAYDHARGGVTMTMNPELAKYLKTMPADFTIIPRPDPTAAVAPHSAVAGPRSAADSSPAP